MTKSLTLFRYRVRIAKYDKHFRGNNKAILCPLYNTHLDNQKMYFESCLVLKKHIVIFGSYDQIFNPYVPNEVVHWLYLCILCNKNGIKGIWGDKGPPSLGPDSALVLQWTLPWSYNTPDMALYRYIGYIFAFYGTKIGSRDSGYTEVDPHWV